MSTSSIHRVDLSGSRAVNKWPVARMPTGLSVNNAHNLVVACHGITAASKIQEYTTHGSLVREICPQVSIFHAVELSSGDYVISHGMSPDEVCVVAEDGQVVSSCRQLQTVSWWTADEPCSKPRHHQGRTCCGTSRPHPRQV